MDELTLQDHVEAFVMRWGDRNALQAFIGDLRDLLEHYGRATLMHKSLPDTDHEHGEPV